MDFYKFDFSTSSYHNSTNIRPIKMQIFHQLDEKIAETFLADFHPDRL